ncbi:MAG TPA: penicillin-binding transpeptidase domain-containing protein [Phycisphaerae bacterium]|nr:penicillin-binding transpeptidase domain-containing protein [Phycisphaerae bacterium]HRW56054.1 penicillin-binding transpeptidase domain-containing protein [Phycisphaerae bacterium]
MSLTLTLALSIHTALLAPPTPTTQPVTRELDLGHYFKGYDGCFVLMNLSTGEIARYKPVRCARRFSPCSTFKIPNALIGLETGVLSGADHEMKWDGVQHHRAACNRDQTLRTAIQDSVLWYFQRVATGVGAERMQSWLDNADYGNKDISAGLTQFWLGASLKISADEQVEFLKKLHDESLPVSKEAQRIVKDILIVDKTTDCTLRGKTGTKGDEKSDVAVLGWFVGTVETRDATYAFACNISAKKGASGPAARRLVKRLLRSMDILPESGGETGAGHATSEQPTPKDGV